MSMKMVAAVASAIAGAVAFIMVGILEVGIGHRTPASMELDAAVCRYLPPGIHGEAADGVCRVRVDDFSRDGKLLRLWWQEGDSSLSEGHAITIPVESLRIATELPRKPAPGWVFLLVGGAMLLTLLPLVWLTLRMRRSNLRRRAGAA